MFRQTNSKKGQGKRSRKGLDDSYNNKKGVKLPKGCFRNVTVTFDTANKKETIAYRTSELVEVIRDC